MAPLFKASGADCWTAILVFEFPSLNHSPRLRRLAFVGLIFWINIFHELENCAVLTFAVFGLSCPIPDQRRQWPPFLFCQIWNAAVCCSHLGKRFQKLGKRCQVTKAIESLQTNAATWHHWISMSIGEYSESCEYSWKVWCSSVSMSILPAPLSRQCLELGLLIWQKKRPNELCMWWQLFVAAVSAVSFQSLSPPCKAAKMLGGKAWRPSEAVDLWSRCGCWASALQDIPAGMHSDELEINDYPQIARQKITHRDRAHRS